MHLEALKRTEPFNVEAHQSHWYAFLQSLIAVPEILKSRMKGGREGQWLGDRLKEISSDPLLNYLYAARGTDHHADEPSALLGTREHHISYMSGGSVEIIGDDGQIHTSYGMPVIFGGKNFNVGESYNFSFKLQPVFNIKQKKLTEVPTEHFGAPVPDNLAVTGGALGLAYYSKLVDDAEAFVA